MAFFEKFITGRLRKRLLRAPVIEGWRWDEQGIRPPERAKLALENLDGGAMGVRIPGHGDLGKLSAQAAAAIAAAEGELDVTVGWPEHLVILRQDSVVVYAEGDVVHFGTLGLDPAHRMRRSGYAYLNDASAEVAVELELSAAGTTSATMLAPNQQTTLGPYTIEHDRSYDPSDRPSTLRQHAYFFRVVRAQARIPPPPHPALPHPLDVTSAYDVVAVARRVGALTADEAMVCEPAAVRAQVKLYEGPTAQLEDALRACGPTPPTLRRLAETVEVVGARVARGPKGEAVIGRASLFLRPCGTLDVEREVVRTAPGRMRRRPTGR